MSVLVSGSEAKTSSAVNINSAVKMSFQLSVTGAGSVSASAVVEGSNDGQGWLPIATLNASGTAYATDGGTLETFWLYIRGRIVNVTGAATVYFGV